MTLGVVLILALFPVISHGLVTHVHVYNSTGGMTVGSGASAVSTSSSSAEVRTVIRGGSASVQVTTEENGVRRSERTIVETPVSNQTVITVGSSTQTSTDASRERRSVRSMSTTSANVHATHAATEAAMSSNASTSSSTPTDNTPNIFITFIKNLIENVLDHISILVSLVAAR